MKALITKLRSHVSLYVEHAIAYKNHYLVSILGAFAVVKTILVMIGLLGTLSILPYHSAGADFDDPTAICSEVTDISYEECIALLDLYNSTNGDEWTHNDNW